MFSDTFLHLLLILIDPLQLSLTQKLPYPLPPLLNPTHYLGKKRLTEPMIKVDFWVR